MIVNNQLGAFRPFKRPVKRVTSWKAQQRAKIHATAAQRKAAIVVAEKKAKAADEKSALPSGGVLTTGNPARDWELMRQGKDIYRHSVIRHRRKGIPGGVVLPAYGLIYGPHALALEHYPTWQDWQRSMNEASRHSGGFFGPLLPTRQQALKVGRVAAVVAAVYFAGPYLLSTAEGGTGAAGAAGAAAGGTSAAAIAQQGAAYYIKKRVGEKIQEKLVRHFMPSMPPPSAAPQAAPRIAVAPAPAKSKISKPAILTVATLLPLIITALG